MIFEGPSSPLEFGAAAGKIEIVEVILDGPKPLGYFQQLQWMNSRRGALNTISLSLLSQ